MKRYLRYVKAKSYIYYVVFFILFFSISASAAELIIVFNPDTTDWEVNSILGKFNLVELSKFNITRNKEQCRIVGYRGEISIKKLIEEIRNENIVKKVFLNFNLKLQSEDLLNRVCGGIAESNQFSDLEAAVSYLQQFNAEDTSTVAYLDSGFLHKGHSVVDGLLTSGRLLNINSGYGINFISSDYEPGDSNGHGTEVISLGLTYSPNNKFMVLKIAGDNKILQVSELSKALNFLINYAGNELTGRIVVNMSLEGSAADIIEQFQKAGYTQQEAKQKYEEFKSWFAESFIHPLYEEGVVLIAAGSNVGSNVESFPGCYDEVISVGKESYEGTDSSCDILVPSMCYVADKDFKSVALMPKDGTSLGTALISAFVGEVLRVNQNLTSDEVKIILRYDNFTQGLNDMLNVLENGDLPQRPKLTPKINFPTSAHLGTIYSALKDIKEGLNYNNQSLINNGVDKIELDLGYKLPFDVTMDTDFVQFVIDIKDIYSAEVSSIEDREFSYEPIIGNIGNVPFDIFD